MRFRATWPVVDRTRPDADLIAEARARLHEVRPHGYTLRAPKWRVEGGLVTFDADAKHTAPHGTDAGYHQHVKIVRTPPCEPCKAAHTAHQKHWQANRGKPRARKPEPKTGTCDDCGATTTRERHKRCRKCANRRRLADWKARLEAEREAEAKALAQADWRAVQWRRKGLIWVAESVPDDDEEWSAA